MSLNQPTISENGRSVTLQSSTGQVRFHAIWLRDNADTAIKPAAQKKETILDLPDNIRISRASSDDKRLSVTLEPEQLECHFPVQWLEANAYDSAPAVESSSPCRLNPDAELWGKALTSRLPVADYDCIKNDGRELMRWLEQIHHFGFAVLTGLEAKPGELLEVSSLFGFVRETNYGKVFNVRSEVNPANLAFSRLGLQAHTDNPYRDPVPTLQILACLENSTDGGESVVVDGFNAARVLAEEDSEHYELLARHNAAFKYAGHGDVMLGTEKPLLELSASNELSAVRFNNRSIAPLTQIPFDQVEPWYEAYRHFAEIIDRDSMAVTFQLEPGQLFIVNNRRVLHGRTGYDSTGNRWLQGCYPDIDGLLSTLTLLRAHYA